MAQVKKLSSGGDVAKAKAEFDLVYAAADAQTRLLMDGYLQSTQNYAAADQMNNRSLNQFATQAYRNAIQIATNPDYAPSPIAGVTTKNIFNGYSKNENVDNANEIARRYLNQGSSSKKSSGSSSESSGNKYYNFSWSNGWDSGWGFEDDDLDTRLATFTDVLLNNVGQLAQYINDGYTVKGYKGSKNIDDVNSILMGLNNIRSNIGQEDSKTLMKKLAKLSLKIGVDPSSFKDYFDQWIKVTAAEKNKKALLADGWTEGIDLTGNQDLIDYLNKNHYSVLTDKNGNNYVFDKDYNLLTNNATMYINSDWTNPERYNLGYGVDANGGLWFGNSEDITDGHAFYDLYNTYLTDLKQRRSGLYDVSATPWDSAFGNSDNDLVNTLSEYLNGKKFVDVGRLFNSDTLILAIPKDGKTVSQDKYGNIKLNNMEFFYVGEDGNIHHSTDYRTVALNVGGFKTGGYEEDRSGMADFSDYSDIADFDSGIDFDRNYNGRTDFSNLVRLNFQFSKNISDDPQGWVSEVLEYISHGNRMTSKERDFLQRFDYHNQPEKIASFVGNIIRNTGMWNLLTPQLKQAYQALLRRTTTRLQSGSLNIAVEKEGRIISAATGTTLGIMGDPETQLSITGQMRKKFDKAEDKADILSQEAIAAGRDVDNYIAGQRKLKDGFTMADTLRFATMAQDVAGIIMSFTGLNAGSAALGVTAMGTDLAADLLDDSVSAGQVAKNALMNAGFAAVSWIPGANLGKVTKNLIKYAPKVLAAASATGLALDPEVRESWTKISDPKQNLTVDDWKNIGHTLSALAGITRMGKAAYDKYSVKGIISKGKGQLITLKDGSKITIDKKSADKINTLLKEENGELKALEALKEITGKDVTEFDNDVIFKNITKRNGPIKAIKNKEMKTVVGKQLNTEEVDVPDYLKMAEILKQDEAMLRQKANDSAWWRLQVGLANRFGGGAYGNKTNAIRDYVAFMNNVPESIAYRPMINVRNSDKYQYRSGVQSTKPYLDFLSGLSNRQLPVESIVTPGRKNSASGSSTAKRKTKSKSTAASMRSLSSKSKSKKD